MIGENWARNFSYGAAKFHQPRTVAEVQSIVRGSSRVKALGTRHSFNRIADTDGDLVSTEFLDWIGPIDAERRRITVGAGLKYGQLCELLNAQGFALQNMASLPHISIGGAVATATHGSGDTNGNLASSVSGIEVVTAEGSVVEFTRDRDSGVFEGAVVNLGALGIVTRITLELVSTFQVRQDVYGDLPVVTLLDNFDAIMSSAYSVSLFTEWKSDEVDLAWVKSTSLNEPSPEFFGAKLIHVKRNPVPYASPDNCTDQGVPGPWYDRLPHFRFEFQPSIGDELQAEYFVPKEHASAAFRAIHEMRESIAPHVYLTEIRSIAADRFWMSPHFGRASIAIHFTWKKEWDAVMGLLPQIEARLADFEARPHWGKLSTMSPIKLQRLYPRFGDYKAMVERLDPVGKFQNEFLSNLMNYAC